MERRFEIRKHSILQEAEIKPQVRILLYILLRRACDHKYPRWAMRFVKRKSRRRELARFHHYKRRNLLASLRVKERK